MGTVCVRKRSNRLIVVTRDPFAVVKRITLGGTHRLNQLACTIHDKNAFMRPVLGADKFSTCLAGKIEEQGAFAAILS